jgi:glycosyltransferase involved in cell wall biosynthesis
MRIAQVAPLAESVPLKLYGGTERVVSWLTEDLVRLGHDVTLFASADSLTSAALVPVWPRALHLSCPTPDPYTPYSVLLDKLLERAPNFDVVHCHTDWLHFPLVRSLRVPFLTTLHGRLDLGDIQTAMRSFPEAPFVSISDDVRRNGMSLEPVLAELENKGARAKFVILDASRRNPFERRFRSASAGLAAVHAPDEKLMMCAAAPGKVVNDNGGQQSLWLSE